jgi:5-methylcytosine-specific restriction protein A
MPRKPKRPCSYPNCPKLTDGRFCDEHEKQENRRYEKYERNQDTRIRYGRAWKRIRNAYAVEHPLCEKCLSENKYIKTADIHHKIPLSKGGTHNRSNLIALCKECHARIHAQNGDRWNTRR